MTHRVTRPWRFVAPLVAAVLCMSVSIEVSPQHGGAVSVRLEPRAHALDLVKEAWSKFRSKILGKVADLLKKPVEQAKAALKKLIDGAISKLGKVFESDVILPALIWALPKIFPGAQRILDYVRQALGSIDRLTQTAKRYGAAVDALMNKDQAKLDQAMKEVSGGASLFEKFDVAQIVDVLIKAAKDNAPSFIRAKTLELLDKALTVVEAPIQAGKSAATSALASVPVVGPFISGAADFIITQGLALIRQKGFEYVAKRAVALADKVIDGVAKKLRGVAASDDKRIKPVIDALNKFLKAIKPYLKPLQKAFSKLKTAFVLADQGPGALAALTFVKKAYNEFIGLLSKNVDKAKQKLKSLADKAKTVLPTVGALLKPILDGLADAGSATIKEIGKCKDQLLGFSGSVLSAVFGCMKDAVVRGIAGGAFESFLTLLRTNMAKAKEKLTSLAGKLAAVFPQAKKLTKPIVTAIDYVGDALVDSASPCKDRITGLNKESAQGLLVCLGQAVKSAGLSVIRGLIRKLEQLWKAGCRAAFPKLEKLGTLVSRVFIPLAPVVNRVMAKMKKRCEAR